MMWRRTVKDADAVTVEAHANIPPERPDAVVIRPGIDTTLFKPNSAAPKPGRIVAVGGLYRRKAFDVLIRATAVAAAGSGGLHVLIAGEGPEKETLNRLATDLGVADRITFLGRLSRRDLPDLYCSAVAVCHPARYDTFPLAPIEAMACGLPVLVSNAGALPEMVGDAGIVHSVGDVSMLAAHLASIVEDKKLRTRLGEAAREHAVRMYSLAAMCDGYLNLYRDLSALRGTARPPEANERHVSEGVPR
jgi:glycosyltransferase involved in cell wall biosynthesis